MFSESKYNLSFKNPEHKCFGELYGKACCIMTGTDYHDDSGCWVDRTEKRIYKNDHFTLIYQPKKETRYCESGEVVLLFIKNKGVFDKKYLNGLKYIVDFYNFLTCESFNYTLKLSNNKWYFNYGSETTFEKVTNLIKPLELRGNILNMKFCIQGFDEGICHCGWWNFIIDWFNNDKKDKLTDIYKTLEDDDDYKYMIDEDRFVKVNEIKIKYKSITGKRKRT